MPHDRIVGRQVVELRQDQLGGLGRVAHQSFGRVVQDALRLALDLDLDLGPLRLQRQPEQLAERDAAGHEQPFDGLAHVRVGDVRQERHTYNSSGPQPDLRP